MNAHSPQEALLIIIGHLGAAEVQSLPTDDEIIMRHVRDALETARAAYFQSIQPEPAQ